MVPSGARIAIGILIYGWTAQYYVHWFVTIIGTFLIGFRMRPLIKGWGNTVLVPISLGLMGMTWIAVKYGETLRTLGKYQLRLCTVRRH
jgi:hypothetical protein